MRLFSDMGYKYLVKRVLNEPSTENNEVKKKAHRERLVCETKRSIPLRIGRLEKKKIGRLMLESPE